MINKLQLVGLLALSLVWVPFLILSYTVICYVIMLNSPPARIWLIILTIAYTTFLVKPVLELIKMNYEIVHLYFHQDES